ncbi:MAG: hypothetical protein ABI282_11475 [Candidatus Baltobacteraceae bacterium]
MHLFTKVPVALLTTAIAVSGVAALTVPAAAQSYGSNYGYNSGNPGVAAISVANGGVVILRRQRTAGRCHHQRAGRSRRLRRYEPRRGRRSPIHGTSTLRLADTTEVRMVNLSPGSREVQLASCDPNRLPDAA